MVTSTEQSANLGTLLNSDELKLSEGKVKDYVLLQDIDFTHPVFRVFREPKVRDFTGVHFWKYRSSSADAFPKEASTMLATFDSGDPAIVETTLGKGTIITLLSGWQPSDSQL